MDKAGTNTGNYTQTDAYQGGALSYDKNTDYSALLNKYGNPSSPDYSLSAAAYYEAKRNAKIRGEGLQDKYGYTTNFTSAAPVLRLRSGTARFQATTATPATLIMSATRPS
jgi:hypothetical protein